MAVFSRLTLLHFLYSSIASLVSLLRETVIINYLPHTLVTYLTYIGGRVLCLVLRTRWPFWFDRRWLLHSRRLAGLLLLLFWFRRGGRRNQRKLLPNTRYSIKFCFSFLLLWRLLGRSWRLGFAVIVSSFKLLILLLYTTMQWLVQQTFSTLWADDFGLAGPGLAGLAGLDDFGLDGFGDGLGNGFADGLEGFGLGLGGVGLGLLSITTNYIYLNPTWYSR